MPRIHPQPKCLNASDVKQNTEGGVMSLRKNILTKEVKNLI